MPRKSLPYQKRTGAIILKRLAKGETLASICKDAHIPSRATVYKWLRDNPDFLASYQKTQKGDTSFMSPYAHVRARALSADTSEKTHSKKTHAETPRGRPSEFNEVVAGLIIEMLLEGHSMRSICQLEDMPSKATVFRWMQHNAQFRADYELAKQYDADWLIEEVKEIADDASKDWIDTEGGKVFNKEAVQRARLRVDARFKLAEKLFPKRFGAKVTQEITGQNGAPIELKNTSVTDLEVARRIAHLLEKGVKSAKEGKKERG